MRSVNKKLINFSVTFILECLYFFMVRDDIRISVDKKNLVPVNICQKIESKQKVFNQLDKKQNTTKKQKRNMN